MTITHLSFLQAANESLDNRVDEMSFRTAASRAYYCMFHSAKRVTDNKRNLTDREGRRYPGGAHKQLSSYLIDNAAEQLGLNEREIKRVGLLLKQSHAIRVIADYRLDKSFSKENAIMLIERAKVIELIISDLIK